MNGCFRYAIYSCLQVLDTLSNSVAIRPGRHGLALTPGLFATQGTGYVNVIVSFFLSVTNALFYLSLCHDC
jgi:hypothetical protein